LFSCMVLNFISGYSTFLLHEYCCSATKMLQCVKISDVLVLMCMKYYCKGNLYNFVSCHVNGVNYCLNMLTYSTIHFKMHFFDFLWFMSISVCLSPSVLSLISRRPLYLFAICLLFALWSSDLGFLKGAIENKHIIVIIIYLIQTVE